MSATPGAPPTSGFDRDALTAFAHATPPGGRVLSAGRADPTELVFLAAQRFRLEAFVPGELPPESSIPPLDKLWSSSFLLLSLPRERYDAIWSHRALEGLPPAAWQRTLGAYFGATRPGGILFFSFTPTAERPEPEVASLLRQNGFRQVSRGESRGTVGFLARRL